MNNFRKIFLCVLIISMCIVSTACNTSTTNENTSTELIKVSLATLPNQASHAPLIIALKNGYFEEEGLDIEHNMLDSGNKVLEQVLSKTADIGMAGPENAVSIYIQGRDDYPILFSELSKTNPNFLVARNTNNKFTLDSLKGKTILGSRPGGTLHSAFDYILKQNNINPDTDINLITNLALTDVPLVFSKGDGDFAVMSQIPALKLESSGDFKIVLPFADQLGELTNVSFYANKSFLNENPEVIQSFSNAMYKSQQWISTHSAKEISHVIISELPGTDEDILTSAIQMLKDMDVWNTDTIITEEQYNKMIEVASCDLDQFSIKVAPYEDLVNTSFSINSNKNN